MYATTNHDQKKGRKERGGVVLKSGILGAEFPVPTASHGDGK